MPHQKQLRFAAAKAFLGPLIPIKKQLVVA